MLRDVQRGRSRQLRLLCFRVFQPRAHHDPGKYSNITPSLPTNVVRLMWTEVFGGIAPAQTFAIYNEITAQNPRTSCLETQRGHQLETTRLRIIRLGAS
jgi:hypothetical protein